MARPEEIEFIWLILTGTLVVFLMAMSIILFLSFYQRKLFGQKIKMEKLKHDHQKNLLKATLDGQEEERSRIAMDLHDEIGGILSTLKLYISQIKEGKSEGDIIRLKKESENILDEAVSKVRMISHNITPPNLESFGLIKAMKDLANQISTSGSLKVAIECNDERRLDTSSEIHLFRVLQELLNNTVKHSGANNVNIVFNFSDDEYELTYSDDGIGMDVGKNELSREFSGIGLRTIASRVEMIGGSLSWVETEGQGMKLKIMARTNQEEEALETT